MFKNYLMIFGMPTLLCYVVVKNYKAQYYGFDRKLKIYNERNKKVSFDLTKEICTEQIGICLPLKSVRHAY